jgi:hypothetical protein
MYLKLFQVDDVNIAAGATMAGLDEANADPRMRMDTIPWTMRRDTLPGLTLI